MGGGVVAVAGPVFDCGAGALVELPVGAEARGGRIDVVHIAVDFLLGADCPPDAHLADFTVEHTGHIVRFTVGMADFGSVSSSVSGAGPSDSLDMQI